MGRTVNRRWVLKDIALPVFRELKAKGTWVVGKKGDTEEFYTAEQVGDMIEMLSAKKRSGIRHLRYSNRPEQTLLLA